MTTLPIRIAVVFAFVASSCGAWFAALRFIDYAKMHGTSFRFVESVALIITVVGLIPMLVVGLVSGIIAALWITRRRVADEHHHINAAS